MTADSLPPAIVLGGDVTALALVRSLGRAGIPVLASRPPRAPVGSSRWYRPLPGPAFGPAELAARLEALPLRTAVLLPAGDHWAQACASLPAAVAGRFPAPVAPPAAVEVLTDKERFATTLARLGIPAPRTLPSTALAELDDAALPGWFVKPRDSQAFAERRGRKGFSLGDRAGAEALLHDLAAEGLGVLLQERIPGPPRGHLFVDGLVDRHGAISACLARRRDRSFPIDLGNSTQSVTVPLAEAGPALDRLGRLFADLGFRGLFDAELVEDARDGELKLLEVNARPWWQLGLAPAAGLDLAVLAYRDALGLPVTPPATYRVGVRWVHPIPDARAWWASGRRGGLPVRAWGGPANAVFAWDDPLPLLAELGRTVRGAARRALGRSRP